MLVAGLSGSFGLVRTERSPSRTIANTLPLMLMTGNPPPACAVKSELTDTAPPDLKWEGRLPESNEMMFDINLLQWLR